jgi:hypothetical protein
MATLTKRATIYFDPFIHKVIKMKAAETDHSISDIVNDALRHELAGDQEDLAVFAKRAKEPTISYEALLKKLKANGKI